MQLKPRAVYLPQLLCRGRGPHEASRTREVRMAYRRRQGIGCMVRVGVVVEGEDIAHHVDYLVLVCGSRADDGLLDLHRRVLAHREPRLGAGDNGSSARLRRRNRRALVLAEEYLLDGQLGGMIGRYDPRNLREYRAEATVDRIGGLRRDAAVRAGAAEALAGLDDTPPGMGQARVYAEDDHRGATLPFFAASPLRHSCEHAF